MTSRPTATQLVDSKQDEPKQAESKKVF